MTEGSESLFSALLESELDAIRLDPKRTADERLDAHLELRRREVERPTQNWHAKDRGRPRDVIGRIGHSENLTVTDE